MCYMEQKMQEQMEGAEHKYNELCEQLRPPKDWQTPEWTFYDHEENWKNYASEAMKEEWLNLSGQQRMIIASNLKNISDRESK